MWSTRPLWFWFACPWWLLMLSNFFLCVCVCVRVRSVAQSCTTLCGTKDYNPPISSVHGNFPSNTGVSCHFLLQRIVLDPRIKPSSLVSPALAGGSFTSSATWEAPIFPLSVGYFYVFFGEMSIQIHCSFLTRVIQVVWVPYIFWTLTPY